MKLREISKKKKIFFWISLSISWKVLHPLFYSCILTVRNSETLKFLLLETNFKKLKARAVTRIWMKLHYFGRQVTIWAWGAQPTLVSELPLQLGSRESQSVVENLKEPKGLKCDSNNHSIWDVFLPEFLSNLYVM